MSNFSKPRLKSQVEFFSDEYNIYFFCRPGVALEMSDSSRFIAKVCEQLNGDKNVDEIVGILSPLYPEQTLFLGKLLDVLDREYLLEDDSYNYPVNLTEYEVIRWSRNIEFFGTYCNATENKYFYQEQLKAAKITILGLGGVGSNILYNLVAMGFGNIKVVDYDKVELSNLNRQIIYNESDIGKLKSEAAKNRISNFLPESNIEYINKKISCYEDVEGIIAGQDIVIAAIDYPREKVMNWINLACVQQNVPFICGSLDSKLVTYYTISPGVTGCIECWRTSAGKAGLIYQDIIQQAAFVHAKSPNVAIMPLISLASGFVGNEVLKIVTGIAEPQSLGKLCAFDFVSSQITISESWEINPVCVICSKKNN